MNRLMLVILNMFSGGKILTELENVNKIRREQIKKQLVDAGGDLSILPEHWKTALCEHQNIRFYLGKCPCLDRTQW